MKLNNILLLAIVFLSLTSCLEEKLAFTVEAAPVLGLIEAAPAAEGMVAYVGTFYALDKSGILDNNVGIDSIPVSGLELKVETQGRDALQTVITGADGSATFTIETTALEDVTRLEWAGTFEGKAFRILKRL
jgi:hypothetical protein